jgi:hypothetical protein
MDNQSFVYTLKNASASYSFEKAYLGRYSLAVKNEGEGGTLLTPVALKQDTLYEYEFWIYLPQAGTAEAGIMDQNGSKSASRTFKIDQPGVWKQISGTFTQGTAANTNFYITTGTDTYFADGITLRPVTQS